MSNLSPDEENILNFFQVVKSQPNLLTSEDRASLANLLGTLPDNIEEISDELTLWYEVRSHLLKAMLDLPVEELTSHRGPGGRKIHLTPKEAKEMIDNIVRQSRLPQKPQASPPTNQQNVTNSGNNQS